MLTHKPTRWIGLSEVALFTPYKDLSSGPGITGGHIFPEMECICPNFSNHYRKILLIRDPRDVMLGFMHHLFHGLTWSASPTFDLERFQSLSFDERLQETLLFPYRNPSSCFLLATTWMHDPSVLVIRFEDLIGEKGGGSYDKQLHTLQTLANFLQIEISPEELATIADQLFGGTWTFRKGQIGSWKEAFSEENKSLFKKLLGQTLIDWGYEHDDNW